MILPALFFYLFAGVCIACAFMVIAARNPVHSVLYLILAFVNASGLMVMLGAEFLAMILIVVYVGAVAVLFLIFVLELGGVVFSWAFAPDISQAFSSPIPPLASATNTAALGQVLYTRYIYFFQASGLILLVAMVGAIVLTLRHKPNVKRQNIAEQVARTKATAMEIVKVQSGQGLS